ncbi:hypothetical protein FF098_009480 [Parvularcula flava]|uniref:Uncharacterized protein n=1 Tax=Aquisalinus luteolus TaxID=1566827 RepID=A0A8J3ERH5_9PROT|nr:hypothetical protein [Aquisalinus luteolus]NHK28133.1 hypothetical protein [Aquisalinus luteolus]GGH97562.1 hypothetical protein GCM10011355_19090 [Aquisalinus luteolus]
MSIIGALFGGYSYKPAQPPQPQQPVSETAPADGASNGSTSGSSTGSSAAQPPTGQNNDTASQGDQGAHGSSNASVTPTPQGEKTSAQNPAKAAGSNRGKVTQDTAPPDAPQSPPVGSEFGTLVVSASLSGSNSFNIATLFEPLALEISDEEKTKNILDILHRLEGDDRQAAEEMSDKISKLKKSA